MKLSIKHGDTFVKTNVYLEKLHLHSHAPDNVEYFFSPFMGGSSNVF